MGHTAVIVGICSVLLIVHVECLPKGYIYDINVDCGKYLLDNSPIITITSDLHIVPYAVCSNGEKGFISSNEVNYQLNASFYTGKNGKCVFKRRKNTNVYTIQINAAYGEDMKAIEMNHLKRIITCTFDRYTNRLSDAHAMTSGLAAPAELRQDVGSIASSKINLDVYDVGGKKIVGPVRNGRTVYLAATTDGTDKELGLRPVTCGAISGKTSQRLDFLRSGCGVGYIFDKKEGFITKGKQVRSPYFKMFKVDADNKITFQCVFTLCKTKCDGSSCTHRSKRSVEPTVTVETEVNTVLD